METARQAQVAFFLTGKRPVELAPVGEGELMPALLARYRDLSVLRYDYPVVLLPDAAPDRCLRPLSALIDEALASIAPDDGGDRVSRQFLRLETAVRQALAGGERGSLSACFERAGERLGAAEDPTLADSLADSLGRLLAALPGDATLVDCDAASPATLLRHVWGNAEARKARRLSDRLARLALHASDILRADRARSEAGRSATALRASLGGMDADGFDFEAMSRVLARLAGRSTLTVARRQRLEKIIAVLESYDFDAGAFCFDRCGDALAAWRDHYPVLIEVARAAAVAELEIAGDYRDDRHDNFFEDYGADGLTPEELAPFPAFLVCVDAADIDAGEQSALMEILAAGLPMKILVQSDDILEDTRPGAAARGFSRSAPQFAHMAVGLNDVFVLQAAASHLPRRLERIADGMTFAGATLFSVYSGATATLSLPAYLAAAAAVEARAFPVFAYDPRGGRDFASHFDLEGNPSPDADWSNAAFEHEDEQRRRRTETVPFTFVDFAARDSRFARHLARIAPTGSADETLPVDAVLEQAPGAEPGRLPAIPMVDSEAMLHRVLIDERLLRAGRRCLNAWQNLRAQAGTRESAKASAQGEAALAQPTGTETPAAASEDAASRSGEPIPAPVILENAASEPSPEPSSDDPYIETPRCTTCNECTQLNDRMFAYDENRQAYIADPTAGTYAELVEAAESCQVSIIHPGKPRDPDEPGLDALLERAAPFR